MTTKQVTVTKFVSCSGIEFDNELECANYESNLRVELQQDVYEHLKKINELKEEVNMLRINAQLAKLDAEKQKAEARSAMGKSRFCKLMADHFQYVSEYNQKRRKLHEVRRALSMIIDNQYMWFGFKSRRSSVARLERKRMSLRWRSEHTPDQWRTPNKIRVSKLPHPARGED